MSFRRPSPAALARARATLEASRVSDAVHPSIPMLNNVWGQIAGVCSDLTPTQWLTPTACPGWTVLDQVSHIIGSERALLGHPMPRDAVIANHVKNDLGAFNEAWVEEYRGWEGGDLLREFGRWTSERVEMLQRLGPDDLEKDTITPLGMMSMGNFLATRVLDCFIHEQDIRRALARPGHMDDDVAMFVIDQMLAAMPRVVAREAKAPDGATVVFALEGDIERRYSVRVEGERGVTMRHEPKQPTAVIDVETLTFLELATGRTTGKAVLAEARVGLEGDAALGKVVISSMNTFF